jgi:hypothetical protein
MEETRPSLLIRAQAGDEGAWEDLCELYPGGRSRPAVVRPLGPPRGLPLLAAHDRLQLQLLRTIASNYSCDYWKSPARRAAAPGNDAAAAALDMDCLLGAHRRWVRAEGPA